MILRGELCSDLEVFLRDSLLGPKFRSTLVFFYIYLSLLIDLDIKAK